MASWSPQFALATGTVTWTERAMFWHVGPGRLTIAVWGHVGMADFERFAALAPSWLGADAPERRSIVDLRRLTGLDPEAAVAFARFVADRAETYVRSLDRCALIASHARAMPVAAFLAGIPSVLGTQSPCRVFADVHEAATWLELDPDLHATHDRLIAQVADAKDLLESLGAVIRQRWGAVDLERAATALGLSSRSLQRRLTTLRTSFRREVERARVTEAMRLLSTTDAKIESIAAEIGLRKPQHLAVVFRRWTGESPAAWRAARR